MNPICVVDYGVGNIHSALKGLRRFTSDVILSEDATEISRASALVLPGQGAFEAGMKGLEVRGLLDAVKQAAESGKPILGICLGAQLLLEKGFEFGEWEGLGLMPGSVVHFPDLKPPAKTPHMGWNAVEPPAKDAWQGTILQDVPTGSEMYFIHSFILQPKVKSHILGVTEHGGLTFPSVIRKGNVYGCQFHPEKSGAIGLRIIRDFISLAAH